MRAAKQTTTAALMQAIYVTIAAGAALCAPSAADAGLPAAPAAGAAVRSTQAAGTAQSGAPQPPREYRLADVSISLSRGACEGGCPVYTIAVHGSGIVAYFGEENVATAGPKTAMIPAQAVEELLDAVYSAGFTDMGDRYLSSYVPTVKKDGSVILSYRGATGSARGILTFTIGDYSKRVVFQPEHAPIDLVRLAELIDELTDSAKWIEGR